VSVAVVTQLVTQPPNLLVASAEAVTLKCQDGGCNPSCCHPPR